MAEVKFVMGDDFSKLPLTQREKLEKISSLNPNAVFDKIDGDKNKNSKSQQAMPQKIIPPFKPNAPIEKPNEKVAVEQKIIGERKLSADEILAKHKSDFAQKKFKPSFIKISIPDENLEDLDDAKNQTDAQRLAKLQYTTNIEDC